MGTAHELCLATSASYDCASDGRLDGPIVAACIFGFS